jgi:hypothetical protein
MVRYALFPLALLAVAPAMAAPRDDVYSASQRCAAITDDRIWLDCYYGAAQPMRGQLQLPPAPAAQTALVPAPVPGAPIPALAMRPAQTAAARPAAPGPVGRTLEFLTGGDALVSKVAIKSYTGGGSFLVVLANGQEWMQIDGQPRFTRWRNGPQTHTVTIWKGAMNTFNLGFDAEPDRYKVRRVK